MPAPLIAAMTLPARSPCRRSCCSTQRRPTSTPLALFRPAVPAALVPMKFPCTRLPVRAAGDEVGCRRDCPR